MILSHLDLDSNKSGAHCSYIFRVQDFSSSATQRTVTSTTLRSAQELEIADVTVLLHHLQELDDDLGVRPDENLALAALLGVHDVVPCLNALRV